MIKKLPNLRLLLLTVSLICDIIYILFNLCNIKIIMGVKEMYKRIIAGVLSAVICSSAITSNNVSQTSWGASANKSLSSKAENESTSYDVDSPDKSTNDTSDGDKNSLQSPEIDTKFGEIKMSNAFSLDVKADESTENESEVAESNEKKPLILSISDDAEIYESVDLGENIKADIYNNGLL